MGKKENIFSESLDFRFMGIFGNSLSNGANINKPCATISNESCTLEIQSSDADQEYFLPPLSDFLDSDAKEKEDLIQESELDIEDVQPISDSRTFSHRAATSSEIIPLKKRKKDKNIEDKLKEVAVTPDWIHRQAQLFNS